jgi:hypothetical protein
MTFIKDKPIQKLGLEHSPVGLWLFNDNLNNSSHTAEGGTSGILRAFAANDGTFDVHKGSQISCLKILNTCLTADEIKAEYNQTLGGRVIS